MHQRIALVAAFVARKPAPSEVEVKPDGRTTHVPRKSRLVVVANRLPVRRVKSAGGEGRTRWETSPGGLVTAVKSAMEDAGGTWVGWPGVAGKAPRPFEADGIDILYATSPAHMCWLHGYHAAWSRTHAPSNWGACLGTALVASGAAALNQVQIAVQRLTVEASTTGDRDLVHAAVALDQIARRGQRALRAVQRVTQRPVLRERLGSSPHRREDQHQLAPSRLVELVVFPCGTQRVDRGSGLPPLVVDPAHLDEQVDVLAAQRVPGCTRPVLVEVLRQQVTGV